MCLINNNRINNREQFAKAIFLERHVGTKQVMINDQQVSLLSRLSDFGDKAITIAGAILAQTIIRGGRYASPKTMIFRHAIKLYPVSAVGLPPPIIKLVQQTKIPRCYFPGILKRLFQPIETKVIRPALQQYGIELYAQRLHQSGQIFCKKLVL